VETWCARWLGLNLAVCGDVRSGDLVVSDLLVRDRGVRLISWMELRLCLSAEVLCGLVAEGVYSREEFRGVRCLTR
jgi:hypothetical protein